MGVAAVAQRGKQDEGLRFVQQDVEILRNDRTQVKNRRSCFETLQTRKLR